MPNRIIKDSIHTSEKVNDLTDFQFRLWVNLITYVDDYGRGDARPAVIKGTCFPLKDKLSVKDIEKALAGLAEKDCIRLYHADGKPLLYFPNWEQHQTIRNKRSKFPEPSDDNLQAIESNCNQMNANVPVIQSNPNPNPNKNIKHKYGEYGNVLLTDDELEKLKARYPTSWQANIDKLDKGIELKGYKYKNHYLAILKWAKDDAPIVEMHTSVTGTDEIKRLLEAM